MCFFLPISPLSDVFRPEDEPPAYHGAYRGTVNVVKVVDHTSYKGKSDTPPQYYQSDAPAVSERGAKVRQYEDKSLPPFPPDAHTTPHLEGEFQVHTPTVPRRLSVSTETSRPPIRKTYANRDHLKRRTIFRYFRKADGFSE